MARAGNVPLRRLNAASTRTPNVILRSAKRDEESRSPNVILSAKRDEESRSPNVILSAAKNLMATGPAKAAPTDTILGATKNRNPCFSISFGVPRPPAATSRAAYSHPERRDRIR